MSAKTCKPKTALCKNFEQKGSCPFGKRCTFAHGKNELTRKAVQPKQPCWFFNNGGCSKAPAECIYEHHMVADVRKPLHLQHPCVFYHLQTPLQCKRGSSCGGDHSYELLESEWNYHYPAHPYPGKDYLVPKTVVSDEFPSLPTATTTARKDPTVGPVWGKPVSFLETAKASKDVPVQISKPPRLPRNFKTSLPPRQCDGGPSWGDYNSDNDDSDSADDQVYYSETNSFDSDLDDDDPEPIMPPTPQTSQRWVPRPIVTSAPRTPPHQVSNPKCPGAPRK